MPVWRFETNFVLDDIVRPAFLDTDSLFDTFSEILCALFLESVLFSNGLFFLFIPYCIIAVDVRLLFTASGSTLILPDFFLVITVLVTFR